MLKKIIKVIVLVLIFTGGLFGFAYLSNKDNADLTVQMAEASFPVLHVEVDGTSMNRMMGYAGDIQADNLKPDITPVPEDGVLTLAADTFGNKIRTISYEVLTEDGVVFVKNKKAEKLEEKDKQVRADINLGGLFENQEEYILSITVQTGDKRFIHYYTKLKDGRDLNGSESVKFAENFSADTFDKDKAEGLKKYLESNETSDNSSFHKADIHSTLDHISWGTLKPEIIRKPIASVQEINSSTASVLLDYEITAKGDTKLKEYFHVKEYFRIRYTKSRTFLLNYERTVDQQFDDSSMVISSKGITAGIADMDMTHMESSDGDTVCFVQDGALWSYHKSDNSIALVFSFYGDNREDMRNTFDGHSIKLINVRKNGDAWFMVNGYMNRGSHEGQTGVVIYRYNNETNSVEEKAFIPSSRDYKVLMEDMKSPAYIKGEDSAYFLFGSTMYEIDFKTGKAKAVAENLTEGRYALSNNGRFFAWEAEGQDNNCTLLKIEDFSSGKVRTIEALDGEYLKPLGFMNTDFVYGTAKKGDLSKGSGGRIIFPMYKLYIQDKTGQTVKEYGSKGIYVSGAKMVENTINLSRVKKKSGGKGYQSTSSDTLMSTAEKDEEYVKTQSFITDLKGSQVRLNFTWPIKKSDPRVLKPKEVLPEKQKDLTLIEEQGTPRYYVYGLGSLDSSYTSPGEAIKRADTLMGAVTTADGKYIWERSGRKDKADNSSGLPTKKELDKIFAGKSEDYQLLDLRGCTLDQVLYLSGRGYPVIGYQSSGRVLVTGYDPLNIDVMNQETGEVKKAGMNDSTAAFKASGNRFYSYIKK